MPRDGWPGDHLGVQPLVLCETVVERIVRGQFREIGAIGDKGQKLLFFREEHLARGIAFDRRGHAQIFGGHVMQFLNPFQHARHLVAVMDGQITGAAVGQADSHLHSGRPARQDGQDSIFFQYIYESA